MPKKTLNEVYNIDMPTFDALSKDVLRYVNERYLSKPMTDAQNSRDSYITDTGQHIAYQYGVQVTPEPGYVYRVNHGNAHNVRVTSKIWDLVSFYSNPIFNEKSAKHFAPFNEIGEIIKLEMVASFYVACRESEVGWSASRHSFYHLYRINSAEKFTEFANSAARNGKALFSNAEIEFYKNILINPYFDGNDARKLLLEEESLAQVAAVKAIISSAHALDLMRCYNSQKMDSKINAVLFPISESLDDVSDEIKKAANTLVHYYFQKSEIQLILTGASTVSTFDMESGKFINKSISEKTQLFIQASVDTDIAIRLVALSESITSPKTAHKIAKDLNEAAEISKEEFLLKLDRVERALLSRDADTKEEQKYFYYDENEKYLLTEGPLPKSIYTVQFEKITEKLLKAGTKYDIQSVDDQVFIIFDGGATVYNLTEIVSHANFEHISLNKKSHKAYASIAQSNDLIKIKSQKDVDQSKLTEEQKKLSVAEMQAINFYTGNTGHVLINTVLRNPVELLQKPGQDQKKDVVNGIIHAAMLSSAIRTLGNVPATDQPTRADRYIEPYGADFITPSEHHEVMHEKGFVSSTDAVLSRKELVQKTKAFDTRSMHLSMPSAKGFWIAPFSQAPSEFEILMPPTQMQVLSHAQNPAPGKTEVKLSAVSDLASYSSKSLISYTRDNLAQLNHALIFPMLNLISKSTDDIKKNAAMRFLKLYNFFDQTNLLNKDNKAVFKAFSDYILSLQTDDFEKTVQGYLDQLMHSITQKPELSIHYINSLINLNDLTLFQSYFEPLSRDRNFIIIALKESIRNQRHQIQAYLLSLSLSLDSLEIRDLMLIAIKSKDKNFIHHYCNTSLKLNAAIEMLNSQSDIMYVRKAAIQSLDDLLKMIENTGDDYHIDKLMTANRHVFKNVDPVEMTNFYESIKLRREEADYLVNNLWQYIDHDTIIKWINNGEALNFLIQQKLFIPFDQPFENKIEGMTNEKLKEAIKNNTFCFFKTLNLLSSERLSNFLDNLSQNDMDTFFSQGNFHINLLELRKPETVAILLNHPNITPYINNIVNSISVSDFLTALPFSCNNNQALLQRIFDSLALNHEAAFIFFISSLEHQGIVLKNTNFSPSNLYDLYILILRIQKPDLYFNLIFNTLERLNGLILHITGLPITIDYIFVINSIVKTPGAFLAMLEKETDEDVIFKAILYCKHIFKTSEDIEALYNTIKLKLGFSSVLKLLKIFHANKIEDCIKTSEDFLFFTQDESAFCSLALFLTAANLKNLLDKLPQENIDKYRPDIFKYFLLDPAALRVLVTHEKTKKLIERVTIEDGDVFDMIFRAYTAQKIDSKQLANCLSEVLKDDYFLTFCGKRALISLKFRLTKNLFDQFNKADQLKINKAFEDSYYAVMDVQKNERKAWFPQDVYKATFLFYHRNYNYYDAHVETLTKAFLWEHPILYNGYEIGKVVFPQKGDTTPLIIYFPGVLDEKETKKFEAAPLKKIKEALDSQLRIDFPDIDFSNATRIYTAVIGKNEYVAGHAGKDNILHVTGHTVGDRIRNYTAFQTIANCKSRTYESAAEKKSYPAVLDTHRTVLEINRQGEIPGLTSKAERISRDIDVPPAIAKDTTPTPSINTFESNSAALGYGRMFSTPTSPIKEDLTKKETKKPGN